MKKLIYLCCMVALSDILAVIEKRGLNVSSLLAQVNITIEPNKNNGYNGFYCHNTPSGKPAIFLRNRTSKWEHRNVLELMADTLLHELGHHYHYSVMPNCTKAWDVPTKEKFANDFRDRIVYEFFSKKD